MGVGVTRLVLASGSPRRRELLEGLGLSFDVIATNIDESVLEGEEPVPYVHRLSLAKACAASDVLDDDGAFVIAADTTVDLDGRILGKPADADEARAMLRDLAARTHLVHTGVTVALDGRTATEVTTTEVTFVALSPAEIEWYITTGEPFDKAGGYGMQGAAGVFVESLHGSVSNVIGLSLTSLAALTRSLGLDLLG